MWAARVPWTAAAKYAAGACAASLAAPPPTDCDAVRRRLTPIGRFALLSETRDAPSVPAVLLELGGAPIAAKDLERALADRVAPVSARLRSRVDAERLEFVEDLTTEEAAPVVMEARPTMDLPRTIARVLDLPLRGTLEKRPWWEALVWPRGAGTDVLLRSHHCIADGASFGALFGNLSDQREEIDALLRQGPRRRRRGRLARLLRVVFGPLVVALRLLRALVASLWMVVAAPRPPPRRRGPRTVAWASDFADVALLKRVAKKLAPGATVNDLYAALVAAALRTSVSRDAVACAVPVHLYGGTLPPGVAVGNHIGAVVARLPLPGRDEAAHLRQVRDGVGGALRGGSRAIVAHYAARLAGRWLPKAWVPASLRASAGGCAVALTNVRGPPVALTICGRPVKRVVPFLPPPPGVAVGAALSTVGGQATLCFNCADGTHDAYALVGAAVAHWERLRAAAGE